MLQFETDKLKLQVYQKINSISKKFSERTNMINELIRSNLFEAEAVKAV